MKPMFAAIFVVLYASGTVWAQRLLPSEAKLQDEIKKYEQLTRDNPRDVEFWHILGGLYREAERWDKAIAAETQAIQGHPKYAVAYYGRGKARKVSDPGAAQRRIRRLLPDPWCCPGPSEQVRGGNRRRIDCGQTAQG